MWWAVALFFALVAFIANEGVCVQTSVKVRVGGRNSLLKRWLRRQRKKKELSFKEGLKGSPDRHEEETCLQKDKK